MPSYHPAGELKAQEDKKNAYVASLNEQVTPVLVVVVIVFVELGRTGNLDAEFGSQNLGLLLLLLLLL